MKPINWFSVPLLYKGLGKLCLQSALQALEG